MAFVAMIARPLVSGALVPVSVELFPFAHIFHAGSRLRIIVDVPGGTRPFWKFGVLQYPSQTVVVRLGFGGATPARLMLPIIPGLGALAPSATPPCPALRGEPCRTYAPYTNTSGT